MFLSAASQPPENTDFSALPAKRRELIMRIASADISDGMIDALQGVIDQASRPPPTRPATAVTGGPPKDREKAKKSRVLGTDK
jgi:hypothetical protein